MSEPQAQKPDRRSLTDAIADLLEALAEWFNDEVETVVRDKVVLPLQRLGLTLVAATAAACLAVFGITLVGVGVFMLLGAAIGYPYALILTGSVILVGSMVFLVIMDRNRQR